MLHVHRKGRAAKLGAGKKIESWCRKKASEALKQVIGTRHTSNDTTITLKSRRGHKSWFCNQGQIFAGVVHLDVTEVSMVGVVIGWGAIIVRWVMDRLDPEIDDQLEG